MMMKYLPQILSCVIAVTMPCIAGAGAYEDMLSAVGMKDTDKVRRLLQRGMDPNTSDPIGNTLLMQAARNGDYQTLDLLLKNKANVLKVNKYRDSALMLAALNGCLPCVRALTEADAEIDPEGWTPLIYAAFEGHVDVVRYLLELDIDVDAQSDTGITALMAASRNNHVDIVKLLLERDADVFLKNQNDQTALDIATVAGNAEVAAALAKWMHR